MKPIIGLFAVIEDDKQTRMSNQYAKVIEDCGGIPIIFPYTEKEETLTGFMDICDGFCFTGGADISPSRYGEETKNTCGTLQPYRDDLDFRAFAKAITMKKPILAICRGMQLVNVAMGGTLYQDLPTEIPSQVLHRRGEHRYSLLHEVRVLDDTPLRALVKTERMQANSYHHQAVKTLGEGLVVMAVADDGIVEAFYAPDRPFLRAYQWHPEHLLATDENNLLIFGEFITACKG